MRGDGERRSAPVVFDRVGKRLGSQLVLDDLSFRVGAGERVTLIGPTCAGKTTILRLLMTLLRPDSGTISVHG
ncbi:MAG: ATP-binding cassette domain-containing protein, partial [Sciscionella sp.]